MRRLGLQIWLLRQPGSPAKQFRDFLRGEGGLLTLEWVAIAAVLAIGAIAIASLVMRGLAVPANGICTQLAGADACAPPPPP